MPTTYKILGQAVGTLASSILYLVPGGTQTIISSIAVTNRGAGVEYFRVSVNPGGIGVFPQQYLYYDVPIAQYDTFIATVGITLEATDTISIEATGLIPGNLTFQLFGSELT